MSKQGKILVFTILTLSLIYVGAEDFSYKDFEAWGKHSRTCNDGKRQSPIDICDVEEVRVTESPLKVKNYDKNPVLVKIKNDRHTANLTGEWTSEVPYISGTLLKNEKFKFFDLHFHWSTNDDNGTEHSFDGKKYSLEAHIVHINTKCKDFNEALKHKNGVAVLGLLFHVEEKYTPHPGIHLLTVLQSTLKEEHDEIQSELFDFSGFHLDLINNFYTYHGSLTTPPCKENVLWIISSEIYTISKHSMTALRSMKSKDDEKDNIRPIQARNGRTIKHYIRV